MYEEEKYIIAKYVPNFEISKIIKSMTARKHYSHYLKHRGGGKSIRRRKKRQESLYGSTVSVLNFWHNIRISKSSIDLIEMDVNEELICRAKRLVGKMSNKRVVEENGVWLLKKNIDR